MQYPELGIPARFSIELFLTELAPIWLKPGKQPPSIFPRNSFPIPVHAPLPSTLGGAPISPMGAVSNTGSAAQQVTDISLEESDSNHFSLNLGTGAGSCASANVVLPSGSHCTMEVALSGGEPGTLTASLDIVSDDPNQPTTSIPLRGTVVQATLSDGGGGGGGGCCFINCLAVDHGR